MIGKHADDNRCPICGGRLEEGETIYPFFLPHTIVLIKNVPAEICTSCHEAYTTGQVTDKILDMLEPLRELQAEVLILSYTNVDALSLPTTVPA